MPPNIGIRSAVQKRRGIRSNPFALGPEPLNVFTPVGQQHFIEDVGIDPSIDAGATEFGKGVSRNLATTAQGIFGAVEQLGSAVGSEGIRQFGTESVESFNPFLRRVAPAVPSFRGVEGVGTGADFVAGNLGEFSSSAATTLAGAGAGFAVGGPLGALAGGFLANTIPASGNVFKEIQEETGKDAPGTALAGGLVSGALDVIPQTRAVRRIFTPAKQSVKSLGREIGEQTVAEFSTEGAQRVVELGAIASVDPEFEVLNAENVDSIINSAIAGAIGGSAAGGGAVAASRIIGGPDIPSGEQTKSDFRKVQRSGGIVQNASRSSVDIGTREATFAQAKRILDDFQAGNLSQDEARKKLQGLASNLDPDASPVDVLSEGFADSDPDVPTEREFLAGEGDNQFFGTAIQDISEQEQSFVFNNSGEAFQDPKTTEFLAGKTFPTNKLDEKLLELNSEDDGFVNRIVSVKDALTQQAESRFDSPEQVNAFLREQAIKKFRQKVKQNPKFQEVFDSSKDPIDFLDNFKVIERKPVAPIVAPINLDLKEEDFFAELVPLDKRRLTQLNKKAKKGDRAAKIKAGEISQKAENKSILRDPPRDKNLRSRREFQILVDGKPKNVNVQNLVSKFLPNNIAESGGINADSVGRAFFDGLGSLLNADTKTVKNVRISDDLGLRDTTIVFTSGRGGVGRTFTFGEISATGPGRLEARLKDIDQQLDSFTGRLTKDTQALRTAQGSDRTRLDTRIIKDNASIEGLQQQRQQISDQIQSRTPSQEELATQFIISATKQIQQNPQQSRQITENVARARDFLAKRRERGVNQDPGTADPREFKDTSRQEQFLGAVESEFGGRSKDTVEERGLSTSDLRKFLDVERLIGTVRQLPANRLQSVADDFFRVTGSALLKGVKKGQIIKRLSQAKEQLSKKAVFESAEAVAIQGGEKVASRTKSGGLSEDDLNLRNQNLTLSEIQKLIEGAFNANTSDQETKTDAQTAQIARDFIKVDKSRNTINDKVQSIESPLDAFNKASSDGTYDKIDKRLQQFVKNLPPGGDVVLLTRSVVNDAPVAIRSFLNAKITETLSTGVRGFSLFADDISINNGRPINYIIIDPTLKGAILDQTLAHEFGHSVKNHYIDSLNDTQKVSLMKGYDKWVAKFNKDATKFADVVGSKQAPDLAAELIINTRNINNREINVGELKEAQRTYLFDFDEYVADQVAIFIDDKTARPKNAVQKIFKALADLLGRVFSATKVHAGVSELLSGMMSPSASWDVDSSIFEILGAQEAVGQRKPIPGITTGKIKSKLGTESPEVFLWTAALSASDPYGVTSHEAFKHAYTNIFSPAEQSILGRASLGPVVQRQLRSLLETDPKALLGIDDPATATAYMFQFWRAGVLNIGGKTSSVFSRLSDKLDTVLGVVSDEKNSNDLFEIITSGTSFTKYAKNSPDARSVVSRVVRGGLVDKFNSRFGNEIKKAGNAFSVVFNTADERMRATGNPALLKFARMLNVRPGETVSSPTFFSSKIRWTGHFNNRIKEAFRTISEGDAEVLSGVLLNPDLLKTSTPSVRKSANRIFGVLQEVRKYMVDAGLEVGDRGPQYFPWVMNINTLRENSHEFIEFLARDKFKSGREKLATKINISILNKRADSFDGAVSKADIRAYAGAISRGTESDFVSSEEFGVFQRFISSTALLRESDIPGAMYDQAIESEGYMDVEVNRSLDLPSMRFVNERQLAFVRELGNDEDFVEFSHFLSTDVGSILNTYVNQAVKRAEYARRWAPDGSKLKDILTEAKDFGATDNEINMAYDYGRAAMGTHGKDTAVRLAKLLRIEPPVAGRPIDPRLQAVLGTILVIQNLRTLGFATFSAIIDPVGIAVRSGDVRDMFAGFKGALSTVFKNASGDDLKDMSEMLGIIDQQMTNEALQWEYGGVYLSGITKKVNDKFFEGIGLNAVTRYTRLMATAGASSFIKRHTKKSGKNSKRFMQELGIQDGDVKFGEDGQVKLLSFAERAKANEADINRDDRIRNAVIQFVDESILRPNPSQRPLWASDPHYLLIFHLKSFMYSFHDRILRRVGHEVAEGNYMSLLQLMLFIPGMVASDIIRDVVKESGGEAFEFELDDDFDGTGRFDNWELSDFLNYGAYRAGIYGVGGTLSYEALQDYHFGGPGEALNGVLGPTAESISDGLGAIN